MAEVDRRDALLGQLAEEFFDRQRRGESPEVSRETLYGF